MKDHYKILGVSPGSSQDEIKKAYRILALRHHPDRNNGNRHSEEIFKEISESYYILGDISSRQTYDSWLYRQNDTRHTETTRTGEVTPATFLHIFRTIREKVFNAGGHVSESSLFEIINGVLTTENLNFLVGEEDIHTNGLIIDEILVSSVFLHDTSKMILYRKLIRLAHGDAGLREKVSALSNVEYTPRRQAENEISWDYIYVFIGMLIVIIVFAVMAG